MRWISPFIGVIDIVLTDRSSPVTIAVEVYSELRRLEQQIRWSAEKADGLTSRLSRDDPASPRTVSRLLVLRSTTATREIARTFAGEYCSLKLRRNLFQRHPDLHPLGFKTVGARFTQAHFDH